MLEPIFHELNRRHFGEQLPLPRLKWNSRLLSTAGRFRPGSRRMILQREAEIEVASYLRDIPDGELHIRETMLHEMIHYFLWHQQRPYGHTAEFHAIMKRVGARRYNPVPKVRPFKYVYECPNCEKQIPARRKMSGLACAACCDRFNRGIFHDRFRLRLAANEVRATACAGPAPAPLPVAIIEEQRLPPSEIVRRLEELKQFLRLKVHK